MSAAIAVNSPAPVSAHMRLWERALSWVVLLTALGNAGVLVYVVSGQWRVVVDGIREGAIRPWVFLMPWILVLAAIMLVRRSKWALPAFLLHVVASFAYTIAFHGLASVQWYFWLGYLVELGIVYFCLHLFGRGVLK